MPAGRGGHQVWGGLWRGRFHYTTDIADGTGVLRDKKSFSSAYFRHISRGFPWPRLLMNKKSHKNGLSELQLSLKPFLFTAFEI